MIQLILTLTLTPKPILTISNLSNIVPTNVCNFQCHGQKNKFCVPNKFCLCSGPKEPTLSELCRRDLLRGQVVAVPAHGTSDLTSPSDGHKKRKKNKTYLFNMFCNPLTKQVFVFVYLTFELRYLSLHCLRFPCWS